MTRWEYMTLMADLDHVDDIEVRLNIAGHDGWEAVGFATSARSALQPPLYRVLLKRPIQ